MFYFFSDPWVFAQEKTLNSWGVDWWNYESPLFWIRRMWYQVNLLFLAVRFFINLFSFLVVRFYQFIFFQLTFLINLFHRVPDHLKDYFAQFQPIFKNVDVGRDDVGSLTAGLCEKYGYLKKPAKTLISSYHGKKVLLTSNQIIWYKQHGKFTPFDLNFLSKLWSKLFI